MIDEFRGNLWFLSALGSIFRSQDYSFHHRANFPRFGIQPMYGSPSLFKIGGAA